MEKLEQLIWEIAKDNPYGFTVYLPSLEPVKNGYAIANEETQNCFGKEGLKKALKFAWKYNRIIGGWSENELYYFDATIVEPNRDKAIELIKLHKQIASINLETLEELRP